MARVLVTGAAGFIGRALCRTLAAGGFEVVAGLRREAPAIEGATACVIGDLAADGGPHGAMSGLDAVVHLAARVHVMDETAADPLDEYRRVNVAGTERLAAAARAAGVKRFALLSSVKVNGEATSGTPFSETDAPAPEDPYAVSKWEAEQALARTAGGAMETVVLRAPLVYGPGVGANFLALLKLCDTGLPLPLGGVRRNARSLLYLGNLCDALCRALTHPAAAGRTFLLRDGEDLSTAALARRMRAALGRPPRLFRVPPALLGAVATLARRRGAAERLLGSLAVDDALIRRTLGWTPPFSVDEGLAATVAWYRGNGSAMCGGEALW